MTVLGYIYKYTPDSLGVYLKIVCRCIYKYLPNPLGLYIQIYTCKFWGVSTNIHLIVMGCIYKNIPDSSGVYL